MRRNLAKLDSSTRRESVFWGAHAFSVLAIVFRRSRTYYQRAKRATARQKVRRGRMPRSARRRLITSGFTQVVSQPSLINGLPEAVKTARLRQPVSTGLKSGVNEIGRLPRQIPNVLSNMPELAEVEWYRKQWDTGRGHKIVDVKLHAQNRVFRETNTKALREQLIGSTLERSSARGKRMLFEFSGDNPETSGAREKLRSRLGIHLGMTGKIRSESAGFQPNKHDHLVLYQRDRALVFTDSRQFGRVRFHHGRDQPTWWPTTVPEIASRQFNQRLFDDFLTRHAKAPIKAVLLMQHGFSGIGNWMADEILWRAKILPSKRTGRLTNSQRAALFHATKFVVKRSLETLGKNFTDPPRNWLIHQKWKRNGICPKHRSPLKHGTIAGRTTVWCPHCQA
jgi:formamidopyrimidine-DNA glycosylase